MQGNTNMQGALYTKIHIGIHQYTCSITILRDTKIEIRTYAEKHQYVCSIIYQEIQNNYTNTFTEKHQYGCCIVYQVMQDNYTNICRDTSIYV